MDENKFWLSVWTLVAAVLIALIGACGAAAINKIDKWEKAVSNGADPMVVSCALGLGGNSHSADAIICNTLAQNRK